MKVLSSIPRRPSQEKVKGRNLDRWSLTGMKLLSMDHLILLSCLLNNIGVPAVCQAKCSGKADNNKQNGEVPFFCGISYI